MKRTTGSIVMEIITFVIFLLVIGLLMLAFHEITLGEEIQHSNSIELDVLETITPSATPDITPDPTPDPTPWDISLKISATEKSYVLGDRVVLVSHVTGVDGLTCKYQWQQKIDGSWVDVDGDKETYSFVLTEVNADSSWRLVLTVID